MEVFIVKKSMYIRILIIVIVFILIFLYLYYTNELYNDIHVVDSIYPPTIINDQSYFFVKTKYRGISFNQCIRSNDFISNDIKAFGKWEECQELFDIWNSSSKKGVVLDLGANIGSCSFLFAEIGVKVYSFEPLPNNLFLFSTTVFTNTKFSKYITIFPYALGKENKKQNIKIEKGNWGQSSFYYNNHDYNETIDVKVLNDFSSIIPKDISLIKIDVEGSEYDLFEGGESFFKTHTTEYMHIEASCGLRDNNGNYGIEKLYSILKKYGYNVVNKINCTQRSAGNIIVKRFS